MESVVESVPDHSSITSVKLNEVSEKPSINEDLSSVARRYMMVTFDKTRLATLDLSHKSNGVAESASAMPDSSDADNVEALVENVEPTGEAIAVNAEEVEEIPELVSTTEIEPTSESSIVDVSINVTPAESTESSEVIEPELTEAVPNMEVCVDSEPKNCSLSDVQMEEVVESEVESTNDNVRFETEIVVETNDNDINEVEIQDSKEENVSPNNILSELGQNLELNEVLRSSDVTENVENNNCPIRQEVFNKEELLDILEGNDVQPSGNQVVEITHNNSMLEAQLALEQLNRLKNNRRSRHSESPRKKSVLQKEINKELGKKDAVHKESKKEVQKESVKKDVVQKEAGKKEVIQKEASKKDPAQKELGKKESAQKEAGKKEPAQKEIGKREAVQKEAAPKDDNIVNALVKDWDDDEFIEEQQSKEVESTSKSDQQSENVDIKQENTVDSSTGDGQTPDLNKTDDGQPQRRLGRVIKKKVIFDPDNPDTYTKSKSLKNKDPEIEKDQHQPKRPKLDQTLRAKSKSPVSKMQWKKPQPKNSKQNKRLTEVDKLLMDEGAVNMIYQLTPEAPKGKKNMKTKAEFIKKLQSSTPEGKEMKFRERKKESMKEEGEAKKLSGKQRSSLSSSVKSPSVSEDFETHSADDSIIYRRHSSSSYSSSCMSPRRLSDVDTNAAAANISQPVKDQVNNTTEVIAPVANVFQPDSSVSNEIINKNDCLTIKKKLNSKLSLALNKRKRESGKTDKPIKKKVIRTDEVERAEDIDNFKYLSLTFDQRVAEICIRKSGSKYNIEVLKEMEQALSYVDSQKDISVTLMMSECGGLCSDLDLTSLLNTDLENKNKSAQDIAESVRLLLLSVEQHSKILCCGVWGECAGVALALVALSDVALAGEKAAFALHTDSKGLGAASPLAAIRASVRHLPQNVVNDLLIFGRRLSASEALQNGLVNRVLWPSGVVKQIQAIVRDIATQPPNALLLKKKLLNIGKAPESTFQSQLESEAALMVEYWTSDEGQETLRANMDAV